MLSSLGRLNADLLTMYYGHEPVPAPRAAAALREANARPLLSVTSLVVAAWRSALLALGWALVVSVAAPR